MKKSEILKLVCSALVLGFLSATLHAAPMMEKIHFIIPGGAGGGWDGTARGTGEALKEAGLVGSVTFENMSGGGGGKAIGYLIENAKSLDNTLMVNSTPIIIRSLTGVFPYNFSDLTLIAGTIGDYAAFAVKADSDIKDFRDLLKKYKDNPQDVTVAGGSAAGSMDHLVAALAVKEGKGDTKDLKYLPFDAGGKALAALLSGEATVLSTGASEVVEMAKSGKIRVIAVTSPKRLKDVLPDVPTLTEQGVKATFINWRGFFGPPGLSKRDVQKYIRIFNKMYDTPEWEEIRKRNGWINVYNPGSKFSRFLKGQEKEIRVLMKELGFLR